MSALYFVSDVHLGCGTREQEEVKRRRLLSVFADAGREASALYIVGDLFDFWFEYRSVLPRGHHRVLTALEDLVRSGVAVTYLAGNHDFAIGRFFEEELGIRIAKDDIAFVHEGTRFNLYHGDGLAINDGGYRMLKKILRNPFAQWGFRWLHPDAGFALARASSHTSRNHTSSKQYGARDGMRLDAERRIAAGADIVVMGHRHQPAMERVLDGWYVNLGDWMKHFTYAIWNNGTMGLFSFEHDRRELLREG